MLLTSKTADLAAALDLVLQVAGIKASIAVLNDVLIDVKGEQITLTATDLDLTVQTVCPAEAMKGGQLILPARLLRETINSLTGEETQLSLEGTQLRVKAGAADFKLLTGNVQDFPAVPKFDPADAAIPTARMEVKELLRLIRLTSLAVGALSSGSYAHGLLLEFKAEKVTAVGTDGHRLAWATGATLEGGGLPAARWIIPEAALGLLTRLLKARAESAEVIIAPPDEADSRNHAFVATGDHRMAVKALNATYPSYDKVIDHSKTIASALVGRGALDAALKRASVITGRERHLRMQLGKSLSGPALLLDASAADAGEWSEPIDAELGGTPKDVKGGINLAYFRAFTALDDAPQIIIRYGDQLGESAFHIGHAKDGVQLPDHGYVVMPVRL